MKQFIEAVVVGDVERANMFLDDGSVFLIDRIDSRHKVVLSDGHTVLSWPSNSTIQAMLSSGRVGLLPNNWTDMRERRRRFWTSYGHTSWFVEGATIKVIDRHLPEAVTLIEVRDNLQGSAKGIWHDFMHFGDDAIRCSTHVTTVATKIDKEIRLGRVRLQDAMIYTAHCRVLGSNAIELGVQWVVGARPTSEVVVESPNGAISFPLDLGRAQQRGLLRQYVFILTPDANPDHPAHRVISDSQLDWFMEAQQNGDLNIRCDTQSDPCPLRCRDTPIPKRL
jgi:hypothetical protein